MVKVYQYEKWDQIQGDNIRSRNKRTAASIAAIGATIVSGTEQDVPDNDVDADGCFRTPITKAEFQIAYSRLCKEVGVEQAVATFDLSGQVVAIGVGRTGEAVSREDLNACNEILGRMLQEFIVVDRQ